jgi:hypothetical protein
MISYLYVVLRPSDGARKVGLSINPAVRLLGIKAEFRERCILEYTAECLPDHVDAAERHAHALLWAARIKGEWFSVKQETARAAVDAAIAAAAAGEPLQRPPPSHGRTERFEMRADKEMMAALDYLRTQENDLPTRAEMARRIVDREYERIYGPFS